MNRELVLVVAENSAERIKDILSKKFEVMTVSSGKQAVELCLKLKPQVVMFELLSNDLSGIEACGQLRDEPALANCRFILLAAISNPALRVKAFNAGADDYIEAPFAADELLARVMVKMKRAKEGAAPSQRKLADIILDFSKMSLSIKGQKSIKLGVTEVKIFNCLLSADGKVVPRKQLTREVWSEGSDRVVDPHITSLRKKLTGSDVEIKTVYGEGYCIVVNRD